jgi:hypothetical protein
MQISVKADVKDLTRKLNRAKRQIPFAIKRGLDATAFDLQRNLKDTLPKYVHNPVAYTKAGIQVEKAQKDDLTAKVGFASRTFGRAIGSITQAEYMKRLIEGGIRLPKNKVIPVPYPKNQKPNKAGNIPRGRINKMLGDKDKFFSGEPKGAKKEGGAGIWKRQGKGKKQKIKMMIAYEEQTEYQKSYPFQSLALNFVRKHFRKNLDQAIDYALKTAR